MAVSAVAGLIVGTVVSAAVDWELVPMIGWDAFCIVYLLWVWLTIWRLNAERTAELAAPEDPTRAAADLVALSAAGVSLVAVGFVLGQAAKATGTQQVLLAALGLASVALSWATVHTIYTLRYARMYYVGEDGGIRFCGGERPCYSDFAYLSFTIGMTFQVSDTELESNDMRRTALRHAMLSFVFVTGILATTINLIGNLSH
jgi:uncharacterized membrane protein